jgi:hypothetical protein
MQNYANATVKIQLVQPKLEYKSIGNESSQTDEQKNQPTHTPFTTQSS